MRAQSVLPSGFAVVQRADERRAQPGRGGVCQRFRRKFVLRRGAARRLFGASCSWLWSSNPKRL
eukprot:11090733-Alexandrium_andersonii.AAC.1